MLLKGFTPSLPSSHSRPLSSSRRCKVVGEKVVNKDCSTQHKSEMTCYLLTSRGRSVCVIFYGRNLFLQLSPHHFVMPPIPSDWRQEPLFPISASSADTKRVLQRQVYGRRVEREALLGFESRLRVRYCLETLVYPSWGRGNCLRLPVPLFVAVSECAIILYRLTHQVVP